MKPLQKLDVSPFTIIFGPAFLGPFLYLKNIVFVFNTTLYKKQFIITDLYFYEEFFVFCLSYF